MTNQQKIELIVLIIERLKECSFNLVQNTDLANGYKDNQELTEIVETLDYGCQLLEMLNQPLFENDKKLILL